MKKYTIALVCAAMSIPALHADIPGVTQAKDLLTIIPNLLTLADKGQALAQVTQNLKNQTRSQAAKVADAQQVLDFITELNPIIEKLLKVCADTAAAFKQTANAQRIQQVKTNVTDAFGALKDIKDMLEIMSMMSAAEEDDRD